MEIARDDVISQASAAGSVAYRFVAYHSHGWDLNQKPTDPEDYTGMGDLGTDGVMFNAHETVFIFGSTPDVQMEFDYESFNNFMSK